MGLVHHLDEYAIIMHTQIIRSAASLICPLSCKINLKEGDLFVLRGNGGMGVIADTRKWSAEGIRGMSSGVVSSPCAEPWRRRLAPMPTFVVSFRPSIILIPLGPRCVSYSHSSSFPPSAIYLFSLFLSRILSLYLLISQSMNQSAALQGPK